MSRGQAWKTRNHRTIDIEVGDFEVGGSEVGGSHDGDLCRLRRFFRQGETDRLTMQDSTVSRVLF